MSGFAYYMISILRDNARPKRRAFTVIKNHLKKHPPQKTENEIHPISKANKNTIRQEIQAKVRQDRIKNIIALLITIATLLLLVYFLNLFFKYMMLD